MNSYSSIVLETKKGVEGGKAEEERPARLMSSGRAWLLPEFPYSKAAAPADRHEKHEIWSLNLTPADPSVTSPFPISSFLSTANSPPLQVRAEKKKKGRGLKEFAEKLSPGNTFCFIYSERIPVALAADAQLDPGRDGTPS